jgi:transposase
MDIEQSYEARTSDRSFGGALVHVERRRRWSDAAKLAILKETTEPGVIVSAVARRHGINTGQLYTWRRQLLQGAMAGFVPVELATPASVQRSGEAGRIEIRGRGGLTVSVDGVVDRSTLKLVLGVVGELDH